MWWMAVLRIPSVICVVERELEAYGHGLVDRERLLVVNKLELLDEAGREELSAQLELASGQTPF